MATTTRQQSNNRAAMFHAIAEELGVAPELVGAVAKEQKLRAKDKIAQAVRDYLEAEKAAKQSGSNGGATASQPKEKKAGLTLSQRRALLRLLDSDDGVSPDTMFRALPYEKLVDVGYADRTVLDENGDDVTNDNGIGVYTLSDEGRERAESINPGYRDWSSGETVVLDEDGNPILKDEDGNPIRQPHGTHRRTKAEQAATKAEAEKVAAEAAKAKADADAAKKAKADAKKAEKEAAKAAKDAEAKDATGEQGEDQSKTVVTA